MSLLLLFQSGEEVDPTAGQTILQRHKVDVALSHKRWLQYRAEWKRERDETERKQRVQAKADADATAKRKREATAYAAEIANRAEIAATQQRLDLLFEEALKRLEAQAQFQAVTAEAQQAMARAQAMAAFREQAGQAYRDALLAELEEEEEALQLLMADDD